MATIATRRLLAGAVGLALCLVVGCGTTPGMTKANFDRIKTDGSMAKEDVDKLMGTQGTELTGEVAKQFAPMLNQMAKGAGDMLKGAPDASKMEDMSKKMGDMFGKMGDMVKGAGDMFSAMAPKVIRWGDENKYVVCTLMNGKVINKAEKGL